MLVGLFSCRHLFSIDFPASEVSFTAKILCCVGREDGRWWVVTIQYLHLHFILVIPSLRIGLCSLPKCKFPKMKGWVSGWDFWVMRSGSCSLYSVFNQFFLAYPDSWFLNLSRLFWALTLNSLTRQCLLSSSIYFLSSKIIVCYNCVCVCVRVCMCKFYFFFACVWSLP